MPRKQRVRQIYTFPDYWSFSPDDAETISSSVVMSLDEYEAIRLIDKEGITQEQCALQMGVARTTVTTIYENARKKIAQTIIDGKQLLISGGQYQLPEYYKMQIKRKDAETMRIAVTYENGEVFQHFGYTEQFKIYDVQNAKIITEEVVDTSGGGHGALAVFLKQHQVDVLICGGIGMGARNALEEAQIKLYGGVQGNADEAVKAFISGSLPYNPNIDCNHHNHKDKQHHCGNGYHHCDEDKQGCFGNDSVCHK